MSLLILPGVVDALVLGWNFPTQVGAEIKYEGHEIVIPARNTHNGWLEEKVSVAVVQESDFEKFLEAKLPYFQTMSGTLIVTEHQITMKGRETHKATVVPQVVKSQRIRVATARREKRV